jgi:hypothetical protein
LLYIVRVLVVFVLRSTFRMMVATTNEEDRINGHSHSIDPTFPR